jgi:mono/diheme cytochrome c family protein
MMLTKKLACPSCGVGLKIEDTLAPGARITCPKCGLGFPVPKSNGQTAAASRGMDPSRAAAAVRTRKPPPPDDEDELDREEPEDRPVVKKTRKQAVADFYEDDGPRLRKRRKKRKKSKNNTVLIVSLVVVGILLLGGGGVAAAFFLGLFGKKSDTVASSGPPTSAPARRGPPGGGGGDGSDRSSRPAETKSSEPAPADGGSASTEGRQVFQQHCTRCHKTDGSGGGRAPDLATIGQNHDEDWFVGFVRNPKSQKPNSRMPSFEGKLSDAELKAVARYLAGLK